MRDLLPRDGGVGEASLKRVCVGVVCLFFLFLCGFLDLLLTREGEGSFSRYGNPV